MDKQSCHKGSGLTIFNQGLLPKILTKSDKDRLFAASYEL